MRLPSSLLPVAAVVLAASLVFHKFVLGTLLIPTTFISLTVHLDESDPYRCQALRTGGRWIDKIVPGSTSTFHHWQPPGCILHEYKRQDIEQCLTCKRLLFVGDSTIRRIFWAIAIKVNKTQAEHQRLYAEKHGDLIFDVGCGRLEFFWDPYLNSSRLQGEIMPDDGGHHITPWAPINPGTAILIGGGLWHAKYLGQKDYISEFMHNIGRIISVTHSFEAIGPQALRKSDGSLLLYAPVQVPAYEKLSDNQTMTHERISNLNKILHEAEAKAGIEVLWSYSAMVSTLGTTHEGSGVHLVPDIVTRQADILLNLRCNWTPALQKYPFDKNCCTKCPQVNSGQLIALILGAAIFSYICYNLTKFSNRRPSDTILPLKDGLSYSTPYKVWRKRLTAFHVIWCAWVYCFFADRTILFAKMQKITDQKAFLVGVGFVLVLGLFTMTRPTQSSLVEKDSPSCIKRNLYLSRDQTEEWKGWMQFVVLLYHYFGMSKVLWVYMFIRLVVASYLFLTGFGHAMFFLKTNDYSLRRVAMVLARLNMLSVILAYAMSTDYDFYYFPALSSFWFMVVYLTMHPRFWPVTNQKMFILRVFLSAAVFRTTIHRPGFVEAIVDVLRSTCRMHINTHELQFRISLDMYVVYVGMLFAMLYKELTCTTPPSVSWLARQVRRNPTIAQYTAVLTSLFTLMAFVLFSSRFGDKFAYNKWHPLISPFPILAYIALRNASALIRTYRSQVFVWLGRCSLETFILQYHLWLAADTNGLLRLALFGNSDGTLDRLGEYVDWAHWLEFVVITVFFLWTSWGVSEVMNAWLEWLIDSTEYRPRNLKLRLGLVLGVLFVCNWAWDIGQSGVN